MTISIEELQALCGNLGLPVEDQGNGAVMTILPFEDEKVRETYGALLIQTLNEGREVLLRSVPLFTLAEISAQPELQAQFMTSLFRQAGANRIGSVGMDDKGQFYCFHTAVLGENTLTMSQMDSLLAGMMEEIRSTFVLARQFLQKPAEDGDNKLTPEQKLKQTLSQAEEALAVIERSQGTEEQQAAAWQFLAGLLEPGRLPEKLQAELARFARPVFVIDNTERPVW